MSSENQIEVLVVDDSALMRNLISRIIQSDAQCNVVGTAMNGKFALQKLERLRPDVIILDLEMPEMNGIEFLKERKSRNIDIPVIILSSIAQKGAAVTMEALNLGAVDFITKPSGSVSTDINMVGHQLLGLIHHFGQAYKSGHPDRPRLDPPESLGFDRSQAFTLPEPEHANVDASSVPHYQPESKPGKLEVIALGISTGGPNALRKVLSELDPDMKTPMLIVQHMPAGFTSEFAKSLDRICPQEVKEAADGDLIQPGRILIAPGDSHIKVEKRPLSPILRLDNSAPMNGHRPSADVLFESVAQVYGNRAMGVIMTGMGKDGARNLGLLYRNGCMTLGQDEKSSVVYGMPRVAFEYGYVTQQVSLENMAATISRLAKELS